MIRFKELANASALCLALLVSACGGSSSPQQESTDGSIETSDSISNAVLDKSNTDDDSITEPTIELSTPELPCESFPSSAYLVNYYDVTSVRYEESINDQTAFKTPIILVLQE